MTDQATVIGKAQAFARLHEGGTFVLANFWDTGSAVLLDRLGFPALATTSAGFAQSLGRLDGQVTLEEKLTHCEACAALTRAPISVDFENGFADTPETVARNLMRLAETGVVGASIEDFSGADLYDINLAKERIIACSEAVRSLDFPFTLTARAENLIRGVLDLDDTITRLQAYEAAGADVLYAPGLASIEQVRRVLAAVNKPINVLSSFMPGTTLADYTELGVRRISLGGALANYATGATLRAGRAMLERGEFSWVTDGARRTDLNQLLS
jgi:2-methylisocitrate lyase-like PEP mutase family enzyme